MAAVTVVITSYNQGPLIREAVESALSQTVRPERIIIVDDGSDEQTSVDVLQFSMIAGMERWIRAVSPSISSTR